MSKLEKAKRRLLSLPKEYTYSEAKTLLERLGYREFTKGKTSGSRVRFFRESDKDIIDLHKPHPGDVMVIGAVRALCEHLKEIGELE